LQAPRSKKLRYEVDVPPQHVTIDAFHAGAIDHRNCTCNPADRMPELAQLDIEGGVEC
jgi:hypothetical protein